MPLIRLTYAAQYDQAKKDELMREVTRTFSEVTGTDTAKIWVILEQVERSDWASNGVALSAPPKAKA